MSTYRSYNDLYGKTLRWGDTVYLKNYQYTVNVSFLNLSGRFNDTIFTDLKIDKIPFCTKYYGYPPNTGIWPESNCSDYMALTRVCLALFKIIEIGEEVNNFKLEKSHTDEFTFTNIKKKKVRF